MKRRFQVRSVEIRQRAAEFVASLPVEPVYEVVVREYRKSRTLEQNALFHALIGDIANEMGEDDHESVKYMVKKDILGFERRTILGQEYEIVMSTTKLNTKEMAHLIDMTYKWAADRGIYIPS